MHHLWELDPWLAPYQSAFEMRQNRFKQRLSEILRTTSPEKAPSPLGLAHFANGHHYYGLHRVPPSVQQDAFDYVCREAAPAADALYLIGDFNSWDNERHPFTRIGDHTWELWLPKGCGLAHGQKYKIRVVSKAGAHDRISPYARYVVQDPQTLDFAAQVWDPTAPYIWQHAPSRTGAQKSPLIYEAHVGMAQEREGIGTYREFADHILPRIAGLGYDTVQLMAIMEHPYYGSFGYHVANFFAPSSRFGTPDDLRYLIDQAHGRGLSVLLDIVHSHAVRNEREGLAHFDGTVTQFFHAGSRGDHPVWGSKLFDYGRYEVQHFLLSNLKYWMEEFRFDGFRFDGVTSMLYKHHGIGVNFDHYDRYFDAHVDEDGVTYLTLANHLIHELDPKAITIAEDVSGMPGIAASVAAGGIGFDYRLAMGLPDFWIRSIEDKRDEDWSMEEILRTMCDKRPGEPVVGYVESHDQSLVGDKTTMFRMAGAAMYTHMKDDEAHVGVERAMALHKLMRLITLGLGSNAYLNFMGNEFGHPEWVDFPREGNAWSYKYARRQWSLADHPRLRYRHLQAFDKALMHLAQETHILKYAEIESTFVHEDQKILSWCRGPLLFAVNLHPSQSQPNLKISMGRTPQTRWRVLLSTDEDRFGGHERMDPAQSYIAAPDLVIYLPCRSGIVLGPA